MDAFGASFFSAFESAKRAATDALTPSDSRTSGDNTGESIQEQNMSEFIPVPVPVTVYTPDVRIPTVTKKIITSTDPSAADYLLLTSPVDLAWGCWLYSDVDKLWVFCTCLASLKLKQLYHTVNDNSILRISVRECLFKGKTIITFDPKEMSDYLTVQDAVAIVKEALTSEKDLSMAEKVDFAMKALLSFSKKHCMTEKNIFDLNSKKLIIKT